MFIKICGITRLEDAEAAALAGADALGFVCWSRSPRYIAPDRIRSILLALPSAVVTVGVFVNQSADEINDIMRTTALRVAQLHGDEPAAILASLSRPVIKAISPGGAARVSKECDWPRYVPLLVDALDEEKHGGTGRTADWDFAARLARTRRTLLAGGLHAGNVAEAVRRVRPFGIDVSSGVERTPGIKDPGRLRDLFGALKEQ